MPSNRPRRLSRAALAVCGTALCWAGLPTVDAADAALSVSRTGISGHIVDAAGHPLSGVVVTATPAASLADITSTHTRADGRYTLPTSPGSQWLQFDGSQATGGNSDVTGYFGHRSATVVPRYGQVMTGIDARLASAGAIRGRVSDAAGMPLTGVVATLRRIDPYVYRGFGLDGLEPVPGTTRAVSRNGAYTIKGAPPGAYELCLDAGQRAVTGGGSDRRGYAGSCGSAVVAVRVGASTVAPKIRLAADGASVVTGHVVDLSHHGIAGVWVEMTAAGNYYSGQTGPDGTYRVGNIPAQSYKVCFRTGYVLARTPTGYAPSCRPARLVVDGQHVYVVNRVLGRGAAVTGHVRDAKGRPLAGVPVEAYWANVSNEVDSTTDDAGAFVAKNLPATVVSVCPSPDFSTASGPGNPVGGTPVGCDDVRTSAAHVRSGVDVRLKPAGGISGVVRGTDGRPMANVGVTLDGSVEFGNEGEFYAYTNSSGHYTAVDLPPGKYQVCFSHLFFYERCYRNASYLNATDVTVTANTITPNVGAALTSHHNSVTVITEDSTGHRLAGVDTVLFRSCHVSNPDCIGQPLAGGPRLVTESDVTGPSGRTTWQAVPNGTYQVCLFGYYGTALTGAPMTGYQDTCTGGAPSLVVTAATAQTIVVELGDAGAVSGRVTDADGNPLQFVRVHVGGAAADDFADTDYDSVPTPHWDAYTDADGRYTIRSVAPGSQTVCFDTHSVATGNYQPQCYGAAPGTTSGGTPVPVTADIGTTGIDISLTAALPLTARPALPAEPCRAQIVAARPGELAARLRRFGVSRETAQGSGVPARSSVPHSPGCSATSALASATTESSISATSSQSVMSGSLSGPRAVSRPASTQGLVSSPRRLGR